MSSSSIYSHKSITRAIFLLAVVGSMDYIPGGVVFQNAIDTDTDNETTTT